MCHWGCASLVAMSTTASTLRDCLLTGRGSERGHDDPSRVTSDGRKEGRSTLVRDQAPQDFLITCMRCREGCPGCATFSTRSALCNTLFHNTTTLPTEFSSLLFGSCSPRSLCQPTPPTQPEVRLVPSPESSLKHSRRSAGSNRLYIAPTQEDLGNLSPRCKRRRQIPSPSKTSPARVTTPLTNLN